MHIKLPVILSMIAVLSTTGSAWALKAFSRDLTGAWTTNRGKSVLIVHSPDTGNMRMTVEGNGQDGLSTLEFRGTVESSETWGGGPNGFMGILQFEPVSVAGRDGATCDITGSIGLRGTLLGKVPGRVMRMENCRADLKRTCHGASGQTEKNFYIEYDGDWQ